MATMTKEKALVTIEHEDWDYSHFYDLAETSEEAAFEVAKEAQENDLHPREVQSVTVEVRKDGKGIAKFEFDREDLRAGKEG
jgi:hypothetical protein